MIAQVLRFFGLHQQRKRFDGLFKGIEPKKLTGQIVSEGDSTHHHKFEKAPWSQERFGPSSTDFGKDHGTTLEFPMCTYKELYRCPCGREIVESVRSLI